MLRSYYFEMSWVYIRMFLKAAKGERLNSRTPNTSKNWASIWSTLSVLTFLTAEPKCVYTFTKNYCVNTSFNLVFRFLDKIKSLFFSLLRYWYSILIWIFDWIDSIERRYKIKEKKWIKKRAKNTPIIKQMFFTKM